MNVDMRIKQLVGGNLESNTYIIYRRGEKECWIIDPGYNPEAIAEFITKEGLQPKGILLTHCHHDHVGAAQRLKDIFSCSAYIHAEDMDGCRGIADRELSHGQTLTLGDEEIQVLHTPGHTGGSVCFYADKSRVAFTGDTVFDTDIGRTDLAGGSEKRMRDSCRDIIDRFANDITIYPGHDGSCNMKFVRTFNEEFKAAAKVDVKLIALDLDGTTLSDNKELTERTCNALTAAMKKGVHVVVATGRAFYSLPEKVLALPGIKYTITCNGAVVTRLSDGEKLYTNFVDPRAIEEIVAILKKESAMIEVFTGGRAYMERSLLETIGSKGFRDTHVSYIRETRTPTESILDFLSEHKDRIENINFLFTDQERRKEMRALLEEVEGVTVTTSFDHNVEIGGATTSKADAIGVLADKLGVKRENIMACGDSINDLAMLRLAALPVAMGNAKPEVKAAAKFVTASNTEDGVAKAIERFVL